MDRRLKGRPDSISMLFVSYVHQSDGRMSVHITYIGSRLRLGEERGMGARLETA